MVRPVPPASHHGESSEPKVIHLTPWDLKLIKQTTTRRASSSPSIRSEGLIKLLKISKDEGAVKDPEPDAKPTPAMKISSPVDSSSEKKLVKTATRCSSRRVRQKTIDSILSENSDKQKQEESDMETTDVYSLGANIDITKIIQSMKRGKRSARQRVKSSEPWVQQLGVLKPRNVARVHRNDQGVGSKKMKRTRRGTRSWRVKNRAAKGKKNAGGEGDASNPSIPANSDEAKGSADKNEIKHLSVPKSDTSSVSKEPSRVPTDDISSEVKDSNGASEISLEQAAILMNNTFLGFTKSKGAVADDLMATTDVVSLYQDKEEFTKFDPAIIPGLDLNDGAEKFDTTTAKSAFVSLCSLCAVSVPDPCVEFAVKVLKDETPLPAAEVSEVDGLFRQMTHRPKSTIAGPSQSSQGRKG
ncbi:hypothetical protein BAE44_0000644 [Dichanthelium oligosanthes]|uniref:Uncharacterized protein n=1 Tax=Dichanthelium oligosanthes TaxID=888268 RepID=A0A1E5WLP0_9POAL|nr:hypothetical protein BAE44_0000644 [Dichanthelium oligosanthes]